MNRNSILRIVAAAVLLSALAFTLWQRQVLSTKRAALENLRMERLLLNLQKAKLRKQRREAGRKLYRLKTEALIEDIRDLEFARRPEYENISRKGLKAVIQKEMEEENPPEEIEEIRCVLVAFGYLDEDYDLLGSMKKLYEEQVGAFYDVERKKLFTIRDIPLSSNLKRTILAHELTHVLQDQHYGIEALLDEKEGPKNDDRSLALHALVEGDATFVTQLFYLRTLSLAILADLMTFLYLDQSEYKKAPAVIRENLIFPYTQGIEFITVLHRKGGWDEIGRAYSRPPQSTEQILHPDKYFSAEPPLHVELPPLEEMEGWEIVQENVIGEFNIDLLFRKFLNYPKAKIASEGWGGDRFKLLERGGDPKATLLIWQSEWDTEKDAKQFFTQYEKLLLRKRPDLDKQEKMENGILLTGESGAAYIGIGGRKVLSIEAPDVPIIIEVLRSFAFDEIPHRRNETE